MSVEEQYEDVLQNIEFGIIRVYREHSEMTDWQALDAVQALIRLYQAQAQGRPEPQTTLQPLAQEVFDSAQAMCEWRLGRTHFMRATEPDAPQKEVIIDLNPLSLDEIVACLKRIRKSIQFWSKQGGRQGYLNYVNGFIL